jgi:hypothetical protein
MNGHLDFMTGLLAPADNITDVLIPMPVQCSQGFFDNENFHVRK